MAYSGVGRDPGPISATVAETQPAKDARNARFGPFWPVCVGYRLVGVADPTTRKLCSAAKRTCRSRHDITVNFNNVPNPTAKIMDVVIDDPHNGSSYLEPPLVATFSDLESRPPSRVSSTLCVTPSS